MKASTLRELAHETVAIVERGGYDLPDGRAVRIADEVEACLAGTELVEPEALAELCRDLLTQPVTGPPAAIEVVNESTLAGVARLVAAGAGAIAALNFASAKKPGGGFLNGRIAQEESLARSSALYAALGRARSFYDRHRDEASLLYTDAMIRSPGCPIIRDDDGRLLAEPHVATFLTSPAPNRGAMTDHRRSEIPHVAATIRRRSELVLALAAARGDRNLVLGAWGCGVFGNDPAEVAGAFAAHLIGGPWSGRFERVVFSVLDHSPDRATFATFREVLARPDSAGSV